MSQEITLRPRPLGVRADRELRGAPRGVRGGRRASASDVRSGGDADLCWRLVAAGWELERRDGRRGRPPQPGRRSGACSRQRFRHGTGAGWLAREHPGAMPARSWPGLAVVVAAARGAPGSPRSRAATATARSAGLLDGPAVWAFELGRLVPNRPLRR